MRPYAGNLKTTFSIVRLSLIKAEG